MSTLCPDCSTPWDSQAAADECAVLDAAEARDARRPNPHTTRPPHRWDND